MAYKISDSEMVDLTAAVYSYNYNARTYSQRRIKEINIQNLLPDISNKTDYNTIIRRLLSLNEKTATPHTDKNTGIRLTPFESKEIETGVNRYNRQREKRLKEVENRTKNNPALNKRVSSSDELLYLNYKPTTKYTSQSIANSRSRRFAQTANPFKKSDRALKENFIKTVRENIDSSSSAIFLPQVEQMSDRDFYFFFIEHDIDIHNYYLSDKRAGEYEKIATAFEPNVFALRNEQVD